MLQSQIILDHPDACGAMLVPIIAGSDKTTVSVATGHQEFHLLYIGAGNISNAMHRSHSVGMEPVTLLLIPKSKVSIPLDNFSDSNSLPSKQKAPETTRVSDILPPTLSSIS